MKALVALGALGALLIPSASFAAQACPDRTPRTITSVPEASLKCQKTIAKEGGKFAKTKFKELSKCRLKEPTGSCPTAKNVEKIEKAALKTAEKIAKDCGPDAAQGGLTSSYGNETDDAIISSCMLSQHNVEVEVMVGHFTGIATENPFGDNDAKLRDKCVKELSKLGQKFVDGALKLGQKCLDKAMKDGVGGDLSPLCIGSYSGSTFTPPTDLKTAEKLDKLIVKTEDKIAKKCEDPLAEIDPVLLGTIQSIFACAGAETVADLQKCIVCEAWDGTVDLLEQQYAENHAAFVTSGADAIQNAVDAASPDDKILIGSGTYNEDVSVTTSGLQLVGCGGATGDRPYLPRSPGESNEGNGITATSADNLLFQSLEFFDWNENAVFVAFANGVAFRDIVDDGNINTQYAVFPQNSTNILVEACKVRREDDAPIYVGQSSQIVVRFNDVREGVAAIEIENSANALVHNNFATNNTGGILVFKDPGLPVQDSQDHVIISNAIVSNNTPNFGSGFVANVPQGTGMMIISTDDSIFQGNIVRDNGSFGVLMLDQEAVNIFLPDTFDPVSADQNCRNNKVRRNAFVNDGTNPDPNLPAPVNAARVLALVDDGGGNNGNCLSPNSPAGGLVQPLAPTPQGQEDCP